MAQDVAAVAAVANERLAGRRIAAIWCSDEASAVRAAETVAARTGGQVTSRVGLRQADAGPPTESEEQVLERHREVFEEIADQYRGETVLVIGHATALRVVVPALVGVPATAGGSVVELRGDADGWTLAP